MSAVELMDRRSAALGRRTSRACPRTSAIWSTMAAALLIETRARSRPPQLERADRWRSPTCCGRFRHSVGSFTDDPAEYASGYWNIRKGTFPSVGAMRETGTTVIIEDVAFPVERLAEATIDLQALLRQARLREAILFGHALDGNLHFVFTQDFNTPAEVDPLRALHGRRLRPGRPQVRRLAQGRARHRAQHGALRRAGMGHDAYALDAQHQAPARSATICSTRACSSTTIEKSISRT